MLECGGGVSEKCSFFELTSRLLGLLLIVILVAGRHESLGRGSVVSLMVGGWTMLVAVGQRCRRLATSPVGGLDPSAV